MISDQIGLDLLRTFVAVCRQGSLSRVAAQTGRTQSALSMQMRRLEGLLERHLFQRTGRGVVPTPEGELFLGYATRILALGDEAVTRLRQAEISGVVRVGLAEEIATASLPAALGRLHRAYPDIRPDVVVEHSVALGRLWGEDGLDIMIGPTSVVTADALITWNVALQWVGAPDYAPDPERPLDLVAFAAPCLWRRRMIDALVAAGREHKVTFTSQSVTALQAAIESGLGIGLLPAESVRAGAMRVLKTSAGVPEPLTVQYGLYAHDRRKPVVDAAIAALREGIPAMPGL
ncbi:LysR family transcriptional regulator [Bosea caraganae]|uniref:LysR family transcriptional regulator n=1 Tax=Bosea caraganae TaxID=2763117 RepID=A0A370L4V7_9HYPH|nr:LysR substrate-binding domain-containing protein [Bosea caraganae]RDJ24061.1 LysR family transcriptional regulator [Bosea caraganae]RDJ30103.1 LysR family transcriptional regulator [Bosea caraganae]